MSEETRGVDGSRRAAPIRDCVGSYRSLVLNLVLYWESLVQKVKDWFLFGMIGVLAIVAIRDHAPPAPIQPATATATATKAKADGGSLGRAYATTIATTCADAWGAAADAIEAGKTVAEAQAVLQWTWREARVHAFNARVAPAFEAVLPEGAEPKDKAQRAAVVALWRAFARGLKGGK